MIHCDITRILCGRMIYAGSQPVRYVNCVCQQDYPGQAAGYSRTAEAGFYIWRITVSRNLLDTKFSFM